MHHTYVTGYYFYYQWTNIQYIGTNTNNNYIYLTDPEHAMQYKYIEHATVGHTYLKKT